MNLDNLITVFKLYGCETVYFKFLSPNDNSKNQVYLGGGYEILNILPIQEIIQEPAGDWAKERFKAKLDFNWINENGGISPAPNSQLILYPKYPEVRLSGFLQKCENAPSALMTTRLANRILFFSVSKRGSVLSYVVGPDSDIFREINSNLNNFSDHGVFKYFQINNIDTRNALVSELRRIHNQGWIGSKRLDKDGLIIGCDAPQCGGYTLEAELGIIPNGYSEPDYLGWEIKNFSVTNLNNINSKAITLMTPEPNTGVYKSEGKEYFLRKYGYRDKSGIQNRINFGGIHKNNTINSLTNLELKLIGFDGETGKIMQSDGYIGLFDKNGEIAAGWNFSSLMLHWNKKHNQACYVPSLANKTGPRSYFYGNSVLLGMGTDFQFFLNQVYLGNIYYDPGIKMENADLKPKIKPRSQFRIKSKFLSNLYKSSEFVDLDS